METEFIALITAMRDMLPLTRIGR